jgi:hypothetical protein
VMAKCVDYAVSATNVIMYAPTSPGWELGLPGTICRLPDLACPLDVRLGDAPLFRPVSVAASVPIDMMDSDLPCPCPLVLLPDAAFGGAGDLSSPVVEGVLRDSVGR